MTITRSTPIYTNTQNDGNIKIDPKIIKLIEEMPKVELHAHVNGCIRESTLFELAKEQNVTLSSLLHDLQQKHSSSSCISSMSSTTTARVENKRRRSLEECFEIFGEVAKCVTDLAALRRITREALEDFAKNHVAYLELRSTPKHLLLTKSEYNNCNEHQNDIRSTRIKCTKQEYIECILNVMEEFEEEEKDRYASSMMAEAANKSGEAKRNVRLPLVPRFIVSIDRSGTIEDAIEHASIAAKFKRDGNRFVVGMDMSGNPLRKDFKDFTPAFDIVRHAGLQTAIHCGEVPCGENEMESDKSLKKAFDEVQAIINFRPDRLGHALLLSEQVFEELNKMDPKIPIECCPTSNVMTLELSQRHQGDLIEGLKSHPQLESWLKANYPISISTDDPGIFSTSPTQELLLLAAAFNIKEPSTIINITTNSIDHCFECTIFKDKMKNIFLSRMEELLSQIMTQD